MTGNPTAFRRVGHDVDFCVVGGGMAGFCAAVAAARCGAKTVLMHDRPVLGGNASSECRMHICGADRHNGIKNLRETGVLEEVRLENLYRNPNRSFSIWDTILHETALREPNLTLLLNCSCLDAEMRGNSIRSVTGWQLTTETFHTVTARLFADCSGDGVLAPLTGAEFRFGREARSEYGESIAPVEADTRTMGMTCLFQARRYDSPQPFEPPAWARRFDRCEDLPYGPRGHRWWQMGYWWIELGGEYHSIHDTETLRDKLLGITYGVWDHIKNRCPRRDEAENWALEWVQFLPAKRESRRYVAEHMLTQNDIEAEGRFEDMVAYGGWSMDDHHPAGFEAVRIGAPATIFHPAPAPYGIPFRSLYSRNVPNLMFAGRDAGCTHAAMSSTRVMGTACSMGEAVGTAAAMAAARGVGPAGLADAIGELQQALLHRDVYLPWVPQQFTDLTRQARLRANRGNPEPVRDGVNRPVGDDPHCWTAEPGDAVEYRFANSATVSRVTLILDSGMDLNVAMSYHQQDDQLRGPPPPMPKAFDVDGLIGGEWRPIVSVDRNHQRLCRFEVGRRLDGVRYVLRQTWGANESRVYAFYVE